LEADGMQRICEIAAIAALAVAPLTEAAAFERTGVEWCDQMFSRFDLCLRNITHEKCESIIRTGDWPALAEYPLDTVATWCVEEASDLISEMDIAIKDTAREASDESLMFCSAVRPRIARNLETYLCSDQ
jgi:hypothetical protein